MPPAARPGPVRFQRARVLFALVLREMGTAFGKSAGGYFWTIAEPLGGILLLSIAFSLALRAPPLGTSFMLFYASGYLPYSTYRAVSGDVAGAVRSNRGLLNYPVVTTLDAVLSKCLFGAVNGFIVGVILFTAILLTLGEPMNLNPGEMMLAYALAVLLATGVGTINIVLFGFFPVWRNIWKILTRPMMILSGVLFLYESVPPAFETVLWYNPLTHIIGLMRAGVYGGYDPQYISVPYVTGVSLTLFLIGAYLLRRHSSALIDP